MAQVSSDRKHSIADQYVIDEVVNAVERKDAEILVAVPGSQYVLYLQNALVDIFSKTGLVIKSDKLIVGDSTIRFVTKSGLTHGLTVDALIFHDHVNWDFYAALLPCRRH